MERRSKQPQQCSGLIPRIDSIAERVALTQDPGDFARLPVDYTRQDQVQAAAGVHLLPQLAGVDPARSPVKDIPGQGVELLDLEQAAPDAAAQLRLREVLENELCLGNAPEVAIKDLLACGPS